MKSTTSILALILVLAVAVSCRFTEILTGDPKAGTVSSLWPDVPPLGGATKADLEIPLGARLAIRGDVGRHVAGVDVDQLHQQVPLLVGERSGAEAVAINGERITATPPLRCMRPVIDSAMPPRSVGIEAGSGFGWERWTTDAGGACRRPRVCAR